MPPKLNRSLYVSVGVMTALSLGLGSLAGCASFDPNPAATGQTPVNPAASTTAPSAAGQATSTTAEPAAPVAMSLISGQVEVGGKPMANASITVFNAFDDQPVPGLVAAGAGNLVASGAGNYGLTQATTITTDAEGKYSFEVPDLAEDAVLRVVATTTDGVPLSSIVGGTSPSSAFQLAQATTSNDTTTSSTSTTTTAGRTQTTTTVTRTVRKSFAVKINIGSTVAANRAAGVLKLANALADVKARRDAIQNSLDSVEEFSAEWDKLDLEDFDLRQQEAALYESLRNVDQRYMVGYQSGMLSNEQLSAALEKSGLQEAVVSKNFDVLLASTLRVISEAALEGGLITPSVLTLTKDSFPPEINIDLTKLGDGGGFSYTDPETGEKVTGEIEIIEEVVETVEVKEENLLDAFSDPAKLKPTVTVWYDTTDANSPLKMKVEQGGSGQLDVKTIEAKIPVDYVAASNLAGTTLNDAADTKVTGAWAGTGFVTASNHLITATTSSTTGGVTTYNYEWKDGNGKKIADVAAKRDASFVTLTMTFGITSNNAVTTQGGSVTLAALKSIIELNKSKLETKFTSSANNLVEISIRSRTGTDTTHTTADDDEKTGATAVMGVPIKVM